MALTRQTIGWHVGSMVAGGAAVFTMMATNKVDVYAIWNSLNTIVANITTLLTLLAPLAAAFGAAYRTWNSKQVPTDTVAVQPVAIDAGASPHEAIVTGKIVGALLMGLILLGAPDARAQQRTVSPLVSILPKLIADAQAASDDAKAHSDIIAQTCYDAISSVATAQLAASDNASGVVGPLVIMQKARDIGRLNSTPQGTQLIVGCAPLVQDAKINLIQFFTTIGGTVLIKGILIP